MGRLGVALEDALGPAAHRWQTARLDSEGIYTHYASAEDDAGFPRSKRAAFCNCLPS